jgi:hypothetical protein
MAMRGSWSLFAAAALMLGCGGGVTSKGPSTTDASAGTDAPIHTNLAPCTTDKDCAPGLVCGYPLGDGCAAKGVCVVSDCGTEHPACVPTPPAMCSCDGQSAVEVATGYSNVPYGGTAPCPQCPASPPGAGSQCPLAGMQCSYLGNCLHFECDQGTWADKSTGSCLTDGGAGCPSTSLAVPTGMTCATNGLVCTYANAECACTTLPGPPTGTAHWGCIRQVPGCPWPQPAQGSVCSSDGQDCDYGSCSIPGGVDMLCAFSLWQTQTAPCGG